MLIVSMRITDKSFFMGVISVKIDKPTGALNFLNQKRGE